MNIIAGLLKNFSPLPSPTSFQPQDNAEALANAQAGRGTGFESVLSGLAQNSESAGNGTSVTPQPRPAIRMGSGGDGDGGQGRDSGGDPNPDPNANPNPIIVKSAPTALQGTNVTASALGGLATNASAPALSLLPSALLSGDVGAGQGGSPINANGVTGEDPLFVAADQQKQTNLNVGSSPKPNVAGQALFARQGASASGWPLGPLSGSQMPKETSTELGSAATTTSVGASDMSVDAGANNPLAALGTDGIPPAPAWNSGKPRIALVPGSAQNVGSDPSAPATDGQAAAASFVGKTQRQADRPSAQAKDNADQSAPASGNQPQSVIAPDAAVIAANAGLAGVIAADLQTPMPLSSTANGQNGGRSGATERTAASSSQQKTLESATVGDRGGTNGTADPTAQATLAMQAAPANFDTGTAGSQTNAMSGSTQSRSLSQPQISNAVFSAPSDSLAPNGADTTSDITVTVLSTETHFAPPQRLSPVQQIADAVAVALPPSGALAAGAASDLTDSAVAAGSASAANSLSASLEPGRQAAGPVKVLNLQLEPPSLGSVTISLNLSSDGLNVEVAASQASTVGLIERDKNSLSEQLRDSGYSVAGVAVTLDPHQGAAIANDGSAAQGQAGQTFSQNNGQAMSSDGGSSNANGNGQNGGNRSFSDPTGGTPDSFTGAVGGGASSGDLYI